VELPEEGVHGSERIPVETVRRTILGRSRSEGAPSVDERVVLSPVAANWERLLLTNTRERVNRYDVYLRLNRRAAVTHTAELARRASRGASALIVCLSAVAVLGAGCGTSSTITSGPDPVKCLVSLTAPPMIDAGGGTGMLAVRTNPECTWTATSGAPCISLSPASGQGNASVELRVTPNDGSAQRDGNINVNGEQIRVSQRAPCRFEIAPATHTMTTAGGSGRVTVSTLSDCAWAATTDVGWISLIAPLSGSGNGTVSFTVAANSGQARTGNVVIAGQRSTVTQAAVVPPTPPPGAPQSCTFTISPTTVMLSMNASTRLPRRSAAACGEPRYGTC